MPRGIYQRTEEHKRNLGNSLRGKKRSPEFCKHMSEIKKGKPNTNKGKKLPQCGRKGKDHPNWKGGILSRVSSCLVCGKVIVNAYGTKYCRQHLVNSGQFKKGCSLYPEYQFKKGHSMNKGENNPRWSKGYLQLGSKNPSWKGGISVLPYSEEFSFELKCEIRKRDNYTCQLCGKIKSEDGRNLPVHHIDYDKLHSSKGNLIALCISCNARVNANRDYWTEYFTNLIRNKVNVTV